MKKLLIIGFVWPEPKSSAAGSRMLQLIQQFQKQKFNITFATTTNESENAFNLNSIGVKTESIELNNSSFDEFVKGLNPEVVLFDRFMTEEQFGWRVAEQCPETIRILDTEDFHGLRKGREIALKENEDFSIEHLQNDITKREIASVYRCDLSLIISEAELEILTQQFKIDKSLLHYLPFLLEPISEAAKDKLPTFEDRGNFIAIGNFLHPPNYDAVLHLKQNIWPLIRQKLPKAELHIYGAYVPQKALQLNNKKEGFLVKGYVDDVNQVMQDARVCLAPLRFGAGLKGKLVDAMQNGTPSMMSNIAAEGIFGEFEANGFIEDDSIEFSNKAVELYANKDLWYQKQNAGFKILNQRFNMSQFETDFSDKISYLFQNLLTHRQQNFSGQLLMHHTLQSTKYMSKWIEAKNK
ncbi:MAG: glycosyltransferase [Winogradskyella sp.]|nr:MAG: glycosyltransferase [Winogradskyella sp.]